MWGEEAGRGFVRASRPPAAVGALLPTWPWPAFPRRLRLSSQQPLPPMPPSVEIEDEGGACVMPYRTGLCKGGWDPSSLGVGVQWSRLGVDRTGAGAEGGAGSRVASVSPRLPRPGQREARAPRSPSPAPQPQAPPPPFLCPLGPGPSSLLTSWDRAPSIGSNLSGALNHSGRRRLGEPRPHGTAGPGGHGRRSGPTASWQQASGSPPTPPPLSLGKGRKEEVPRAVTSEAVCTNGL